MVTNAINNSNNTKHSELLCDFLNGGDLLKNAREVLELATIVYNNAKTDYQRIGKQLIELEQKSGAKHVSEYIIKQMENEFSKDTMDKR
jgi:hypothetical protein